jgi:hypothetical protein
MKLQSSNFHWFNYYRESQKNEHFIDESEKFLNFLYDLEIGETRGSIEEKMTDFLNQMSNTSRNKNKKKGEDGNATRSTSSIRECVLSKHHSKHKYNLYPSLSQENKTQEVIN